MRRTSEPSAIRLPLPCEANDSTTKPPKASAAACASPTLSSKLPCAIPRPRLAVFTTCGPTCGTAEEETERSLALGTAPPAPASTDPSAAPPPPVEPAELSEPPELHALTASASTSGTSSASFFISASFSAMTLASTCGRLRKFPAHGGLPLLRRRSRSLQRDRRAGNREQRRLPELVRSCASHLPRSLPRRLPRAHQIGSRGAHDRGIRPLPSAVRL